MMNRNVLLVIGSVTGIGIAISTYGHVSRKRKDKLAAELVREITRLVKPATAGLLSEDAFDIHFKAKVLEKVGGRIKVLKPDFATKYAKEIKDAWGFWNDDENVIYGVFRKLRDKVQVSQVANAYQTAYKENLIDVLHDRLAETEIKKVLAIVDPLPNYRRA